MCVYINTKQTKTN